MKLNARIRKILKELNHWHCVEAFEKQGVVADNITIYETGHVRNQPGIFVVSHRCYDPKHEGEPLSQQYWGGEFAIRSLSSNPTRIGKMMGIKTRDRRISVYTSKGRTIQEFLHRVAWIDACRLTRDRTQINDKTSYSKGKYVQGKAA